MGGGKERKLGCKWRRLVAAHFSSRGFQAAGSPPEQGTRQAGGSEAVGRRCEARGCRERRRAGPEPPAPALKEFFFRRVSPPPTTRWRRDSGEPGRRGWGRKRGGGEAETKRRPPGAEAGSASPGGVEVGGRRRAGEGSGLTFSVVRAPRRPPW